jgi:tetratricopeptide (TPR) repeat protein
MIRLEELEAAVESGRGEEPLASLVPEPGPVETLTGDHFPHVHPDHPLDMAMRRLASSGYHVLPVVSRTNVRDLKGTISIPDVLQAYQAADGSESTDTAPDNAKTSAPLLAGVLMVLVALAMLGGFLNYYYRAERTARAQRYYQSGNELLAKDRVEEAIEQYRNAVSVSHSTPHRLALGLALEKSHRFSEARIYLNEVVREDPANGPANAGLARIDTEEGDIDRALIDYQRAVDGTWPEKPAEKRFQTRLEMVESLQKAGRRVQAQSELLAAAAAVPDNSALQKQVGRMLIDYGSPQQAAGLYRQVLAGNPQDAGAWDGLGEAEFSAGNYHPAREAFAAALKIDPADSSAARQLDVLDRVFALDPAARGLSAAERYRRSRELLSEVIAGLETCSQMQGPDVQAAKSQVAQKKRPPSWSDAAEATKALAERLWKQRPPSCAPAKGALAILLQ